MFEKCVRHGCDINLRDELGNTVLHVLIYWVNEHSGPDAGAADVDKGLGSYSEVTSLPLIDMLETIDNYGADISATNEIGHSPITLASGRCWEGGAGGGATKRGGGDGRAFDRHVGPYGLFVFVLL